MSTILLIHCIIMLFIWSSAFTNCRISSVWSRFRFPASNRTSCSFLYLFFLLRDFFALGYYWYDCYFGAGRQTSPLTFIESRWRKWWTRLNFLHVDASPVQTAHVYARMIQAQCKRALTTPAMLHSSFILVSIVLFYKVISSNMK